MADKLTDAEKDALISAATGIIVSLLSPADAKHARAILDAGVKHGMEREAGIETAGSALNALIVRAQDILTAHIEPPATTRNNAEATINLLLSLFDGPTQRVAQTEWRAAIRKAIP